MEDKTPIYLLIIVGIVALVGIIVLLSNGSSSSAPVMVDDSGSANAITGNVAGYSGEAVSSGFAQVLFTLFLVGVAGFMYFRKD
jgi:hypothetical protein